VVRAVRGCAPTHTLSLPTRAPPPLTPALPRRRPPRARSPPPGGLWTPRQTGPERRRTVLSGGGRTLYVWVVGWVGGWRGSRRGMDGDGWSEEDERRRAGGGRAGCGPFPLHFLFVFFHAPTLSLSLLSSLPVGEPQTCSTLSLYSRNTKHGAFPAWRGRKLGACEEARRAPPPLAMFFLLFSPLATARLQHLQPSIPSHGRPG